MFLMKLLTASESVLESLDSLVSNSSDAPVNLTFWGKYGMYILIGGFLLLGVLWMFWSSRKRRKQQEEEMEKISSLKPGSQVETLGGIFGTIVEMNKKENTFIMETGSDKFGKTYLCMDRRAIGRIIDAAEGGDEEGALEDVAPEFAPVAEETEASDNKQD